MEVNFRRVNEGIVLYVNGELDEFSASGAKNILDKIINDNPNAKYALFDLSGLSFMDSTGIGLLIGRYKKLKQFNIPSFITGATVSTEKVIEVSGLYKIMPRY